MKITETNPWRVSLVKYSGRHEIKIGQADILSCIKYTDYLKFRLKSSHRSVCFRHILETRKTTLWEIPYFHYVNALVSRGQVSKIYTCMHVYYCFTF